MFLSFGVALALIFENHLNRPTGLVQCASSTPSDTRQFYLSIEPVTGHAPFTIMKIVLVQRWAVKKRSSVSALLYPFMNTQEREIVDHFPDTLGRRSSVY